ncbi:NACHT domain-containing protein [Leptothoe spongobia]|uniref:NACHT domain-containing protein n=1 Tax=Leptothoe spongobia TAU-MAC 1115 TaxID=1967444 RepID=A0A947GK95_9CYAN|nr:NACHT domain-containing protein [Leptothoe spongobia]MBT9317680.1 NACHT domain-containing protein [Leptothoe spongobia TAU-MAC 1115]
MPLSDELKNILDRIEARSYTEADLTTLRQLLSTPSNLVIEQLKSEYNINIEQARGFHIGDIYITSDTEVIQAVVQDDQERLDRLKKLQEKSRASCIARFRIAVASRERAIALADDQSLGIPPKSLNLEPGNVSVLTGELGIGKTLIAQRLFQQGVTRAIDEPNAPIPIYLESGEWQNNSSLEKIVNTAATGLGRPEFQGATVFLDGLDEVGATVATQILKEAYELVEIWPNTALLITSRPIRCLDDLVEKKEKISVLPLSEQQVHELIEKVLGQKIWQGDIRPITQQ